MFYDTVDAKVIKKTQDNVKDTTLSEKIKLIKTKEIRTEDNKGNVSIYLSQNCNPLHVISIRLMIKSYIWNIPKMMMMKKKL